MTYRNLFLSFERHLDGLRLYDGIRPRVSYFEVRRYKFVSHEEILLVVTVHVRDVVLVDLSRMHGVVDCDEEVEQVLFSPLEYESVFPIGLVELDSVLLEFYDDVLVFEGIRPMEYVVLDRVRKLPPHGELAFDYAFDDYRSIEQRLLSLLQSLRSHDFLAVRHLLLGEFDYAVAGNDGRHYRVFHFLEHLDVEFVFKEFLQASPVSVEVVVEERVYRASWAFLYVVVFEREVVNVVFFDVDSVTHRHFGLHFSRH